MTDEHTSVMIALLPTDQSWSKLALPHLTLVFAGKKDKLSATNFSDIAKDTSMLASLSSPMTLNVVAKEIFGRGDEEVEAFRLQPTMELWAMRRAVEKWNKSEYDFNPHITIGPVGTYVETVPRRLHFHTLLLASGSDHLAFSLRRNNY